MERLAVSCKHMLHFHAAVVGSGLCGLNQISCTILKIGGHNLNNGILKKIISCKVGRFAVTPGGAFVCK